jgi:hypothetical protein
VNERQSREHTRLIQYRTAFGSPEGKAVLDDLRQRFLFQDSRPHVAANNSLGIAWIDGQRSLLAAVQHWLTVDINTHLDRLADPARTEDDPYGVG